MKVKKAKGFTLVELLVVISIIAILSVAGITVFSSVQKNARDARRRADLRAIAQALEVYKNNTGTYPLTATGQLYSTNAQPWIPGLDTNYMVSIPTDPINSGNPGTGGFAYVYVASSTYMEVGKYFVLTTHLENPSAADMSTSCLTSPATGGVYRWGGPVGEGTGWRSESGRRNYFVCNQQ